MTQGQSESLESIKTDLEKFYGQYPITSEIVKRFLADMMDRAPDAVSGFSKQSIAKEFLQANPGRADQGLGPTDELVRHTIKLLNGQLAGTNDDLSTPIQIWSQLIKALKDQASGTAYSFVDDPRNNEGNFGPSVSPPRPQRRKSKKSDCTEAYNELLTTNPKRAHAIFVGYLIDESNTTRKPKTQKQSQKQSQSKLDAYGVYAIYEYPTFQNINNTSVPNLDKAKDEFDQFLRHTTLKKLKNLLVAGQHRLLEYQEAAQHYGTKDAINATPENIAIYAIAIFEELLGPNAKPPYVVSMDTLQTRAERDAKDPTLGWVADAFYNILDKNKNKKSLGLYDLLWTRYDNNKPPLGAELSLDSYSKDVQEHTKWASIKSIGLNPNEKWQADFKAARASQASQWDIAFDYLPDEQKTALAPILLKHEGTLYCQIEEFESLVKEAKERYKKGSNSAQKIKQEVLAEYTPPSHKEPTDDREAAAILETMVYGKENTL